MIPAYWSPTKKLMLLGAMAGGKLVEDTALGNPLTFITDVSNPLKSLLIPFTPQQEGTGDPSPQNIRPIVPWNGLTVFGGGKNLFNKDDTNVQLDKRIATGGTIISSQYGQAVTGFIPVKAGAKYIINNYINQNYFSCFYSDKDITKPVGSIFANNEFPKIAPSGAKYLIVTIGNTGINTFQLEVGQTATAYEPYHPITETDIVFPSPVYGGEHEAVSGKLMNGWNKKTVAEIRMDKKADHIFQCYFSDRKYGAGVFSVISDTYKTITAVASTGSTIETLYATYGDGIYINFGSGTFYICDSNYTEVEAFQTAMADTVVVYELATPQEITLTPEQITALVGDNTIWSDANGQMTAVYLKKG